MKHASNRDFFAHWEQARGRSLAPDRASFSPDALGTLLADAFVASRDATGGFSFRVAGSRLCALAGRDLKGEAIASLFDSTAQSELAEIMAVTADESLPTVAGLAGTYPTGETCAIELLLLPFAYQAEHSASLTGAFAIFEQPPLPLPPLHLVSWRHIHPPRLTSPRMVQRLNLFRGLTVYEGLR